MNNKITIAIDGYSSTGKSTIAKQLANKLGYIYVDTGAMYRAITLYALQHNLTKPELNSKKLIECLPEIEVSFEYNKTRGASDVLLNGKNVEKEIRQMEVSNNVSPVAAVKEVRKKLVELQQKMGEQKGVVMDGRDIGTVVFPDAELKIFMTASDEIRAQRRFNELKEKGNNITLVEVQKNLKERDHIDTTRVEDPLRQAEDARVIDNSDLTRENQFELALSWVEEVKALA